MIEVRMTFASPDEMIAFFRAPAVDADAPTPAKRGKKKAAEPETTGTGAGGSAADPLAGILAPQSPMTAPPVAMGAPVVMLEPGPRPGTAVVANPPAAPAVEQKHLIAAFTKLGQTKGRDAFAAPLAHFGVTAVVGPAGVGIPQERWAEAIVLVANALGVEPAAFLASLK